MQSAAYENGILFFASMDGSVYAVEASDGSLVWKRFGEAAGFSTTVLLAEGLVIGGSRRGRLYALEQETGKVRWVFQAGGPFLASPSYSDDVVYAPAEDMRVYAVDARRGKKVWVSGVLEGAGFKEYYPVGG